MPFGGPGGESWFGELRSRHDTSETCALPDLYAALKRLELSRQVKIKVRRVGKECPTHTSNHGTHTHMAENGRKVLNSLGN